MKAELNEYDSGFWLELKPETPEETSTLVRMKLNAKAEAPEIHVEAGKAGISGTVVVKKLTKFTSYVR